MLDSSSNRPEAGPAHDQYRAGPLRNQPQSNHNDNIDWEMFQRRKKAVLATENDPFLRSSRGMIYYID